MTVWSRTPSLIGNSLIALEQGAGGFQQIDGRRPRLAHEIGEHCRIQGNQLRVFDLDFGAEAHQVGAQPADRERFAQPEPLNGVPKKMTRRTEVTGSKK